MTSSVQNGWVMPVKTRNSILPRPLVTLFSGLLTLLLIAAMASLSPATAQARGAKKKSAPRPAIEASEAAPDSPVLDAVSKFGAQSFDLLLLRPMGLVATAGGVAFFVLSSPLTAVSTATDFQTSWDIFIQAPWEFTTERPLGDL